MAFLRRRSSNGPPPPVEERAAHPFLVGASSDASSTHAGITVGPDQALRLSAVWACVRLLADSLSTLPVDVYRRAGDVQVPLPTPPLLQSPAAGWPMADWLWQVTACLLLRGNAYGLVTARTGPTLLPAQIELVSPDLVTVGRKDDGRVEYRVGAEEVDTADVFHLRAFPMPGQLVGLSPVAYARQAVGLGLAVEKFGANFFERNAMPAGVLVTDGQVNRETATTIKAQWKAAHSDHRDIAVISGGMKFQPIAINPDEGQFLETAKFTVAQVARVFGVPPEMIGSESGGSLTYANVEQRNLDFLTFTLGPWVARIEHALSQLLPRGQFVKLNTGALLRTDLKTRYEAHAIGLASGFLTVDEVRALEDLPAL